MRALIAAALFLATPTMAQERMTQDNCETGWVALSSMVMPESAPQTSSVSDDGWCELRDVTLPFDRRVNAQFDLIRWRASDMARVTDLGLPPRSLDLDVQGFRTLPQTGDPVYDYMLGLQASVTQMAFGLRFRWDGVQNAVLLDSVYFDVSPGNRIEGSARIDGVNLTDMGSLQASAGTMGVRELTLKSDFDGWFEALGATVLAAALDRDSAESPQAQVDGLRRLAIEAVSHIPDAAMPAPSRMAMVSFLEVLPKPRGTAQLQLSADAPLGAARAMGLSVMAPDAEPADLIAAALDGVTVLFTWSPQGAAQ